MSGAATAAPAAAARAQVLPGGAYAASIAQLNGVKVRFATDSADAAGLGDLGGDEALSPTARSALSSYDSLSDGGTFLDAAISLASNLDLHFGISTLTTSERLAQSPQAVSRALAGGNILPRQSVGAAAGLAWKFAPWGTLGLTASQGSEQDARLGGGAPASARIAGAGLNARFSLGGGWMTAFAYHEGTVQLSAAPSLTSSFAARSYGISVGKLGVFSNHDALALAVSRPGPIYSGAIDLTAPSGVDLTRSLLGGKGNAALGSPETDVELGYITTFFDGALALQANAGYRLNEAGQSGSNAVTVLSRAKINF